MIGYNNCFSIKAPPPKATAKKNATPAKAVKNGKAPAKQESEDDDEDDDDSGGVFFFPPSNWEGGVYYVHYTYTVSFTFKQEVEGVSPYSC